MDRLVPVLAFGLLLPNMGCAPKTAGWIVAAGHNDRKRVAAMSFGCRGIAPAIPSTPLAKTRTESRHGKPKQ